MLSAALERMGAHLRLATLRTNCGNNAVNGATVSTPPATPSATPDKMLDSKRINHKAIISNYS